MGHERSLKQKNSYPDSTYLRLLETMTQSDNERLRRWRLMLGGGQADGICTGSDDNSLTLSGTDQAIDNALSALYNDDANGWLRQRSGGLGS